MYEDMTDEELYQFHLEHQEDEELVRPIEQMERFKAYTRDKDYTVWRRTQEWTDEDVKRWGEEKVCPRCKRNYTCPPATSRLDGSDICPVCGAEEGLNAVGINDESVLRAIEKAEKQAGRIV